jgi:hypothetical protein
VNFCRVSGGGDVSCWGDGTLANVPSAAAAGLSVGSCHACARLVATGKIMCWGEDDAAQLGAGGYAAPGPVEPLGQP